MDMATSGAQYQLILEQRATLCALLRRQMAVAGTLEQEKWQRKLPELDHELSNDDFKVLVLGEFKRGKSTLINALLGQDVLPAQTLPCTAVINEVKWGEEPRARLYFRSDHDGQTEARPPEEIPVDELEDYVVIQDDKDEIRGSPYDRVELEWPLELCRNGVEIIDSPGLNEHEVRERVTLDYLTRVDAVVFVLSCKQPAARSEMQVIQQLNALGHEDIFFVCTHFDDIHSDREKGKVRQYLSDKLAPWTRGDAGHVFFVSALAGLDARLEHDRERFSRSGVGELEDALERFLASGRGRAKLLVRARSLKIAIREARRLVPERRAMLNGEVDTLEQRYREAQQPLQDLEAERRQIVERVRLFIEDTRNIAQDLTRTYFDDLERKIRDWSGSYEIEQPIKFFSTKGSREQAEVVVEEVVEFLTAEIESDFTSWGADVLRPRLAQRLEGLSAEVEEKTEAFLQHVHELWSTIIPEELELEELSSIDGRRISATERILSGAAGLMFGIGSAGVGATFGYREMMKTILPQLVIAGAAVLLVAANPAVVIPALLAGGILQIMQGLLTMDAVNQRIKDSITEKFVDELRARSAERAADTARAVAAKLEELKNGIDRGLESEIQNIAKQVESALREKRKGQAAVDESVRRLDDIGIEIDRIEEDLDNLILEVAAGQH